MTNIMQINSNNQFNTSQRNGLSFRAVSWQGALASIERGCFDSKDHAFCEVSAYRGIAYPLSGSKKQFPAAVTLALPLAAKGAAANSKSLDDKNNAAVLSGDLPKIYRLNWSTFRWNLPSLLC